MRMVQGIDYITALSADPQANVDLCWLEPQRQMIAGILPPLTVRSIDQEARHA